MTDTETLAPTDATEATDQQKNQAAAESAEKNYTQKEVDDMMARMKGSLEKKLLKPYADLGDPKQLRELKHEAEERAQKEAIDRGEFEKTLQELAAKKDAEILKRDQVIKEYKVNTPLIDSAAKYKSVSPEQVRNLLKDSVKLNDHGDVEVIATDGSVRYDDKGNLLSVDSLVKEFLDDNPHFVSAGPSTTNTQSSVSKTLGKNVKLEDLDMNNAAHRDLYKEMKMSGKF